MLLPKIFLKIEPKVRKKNFCQDFKEMVLHSTSPDPSLIIKDFIEVEHINNSGNLSTIEAKKSFINESRKEIQLFISDCQQKPTISSDIINTSTRAMDLSKYINNNNNNVNLPSKFQTPTRTAVISSPSFSSITIEPLQNQQYQKSIIIPSKLSSQSESLSLEIVDLSFHNNNSHIPLSLSSTSTTISSNITTPTTNITEKGSLLLSSSTSMINNNCSSSEATSTSAATSSLLSSSTIPSKTTTTTSLKYPPSSLQQQNSSITDSNSNTLQLEHVLQRYQQTATMTLNGPDWFHQLNRSITTDGSINNNNIDHHSNHYSSNPSSISSCISNIGANISSNYSILEHMAKASSTTRSLGTILNSASIATSSSTSSTNTTSLSTISSPLLPIPLQLPQQSIQQPNESLNFNKSLFSNSSSTTTSSITNTTSSINTNTSTTTTSTLDLRVINNNTSHNNNLVNNQHSTTLMVSSSPTLSLTTIVAPNSNIQLPPEPAHQLPQLSSHSHIVPPLHHRQLTSRHPGIHHHPLYDPLLAVPPPFPIQQPPLLISPDQSTCERSETVIEGERIACFTVGGEKRLCFPQILNIVLENFKIEEINSVMKELQIYCSTCTPEQMEVLKRFEDIPLTAPSCGLITKTDAHRLCSTI